jgi:hypothetical protein
VRAAGYWAAIGWFVVVGGLYVIELIRIAHG